MTKKNYKTEITLYSPEENESEDCRERIFVLIDKMVEAKRITQDKNELQSKRDCAIYEIKYLAKRLLWETNA